MSTREFSSILKVRRASSLMMALAKHPHTHGTGNGGRPRQVQRVLSSVMGHVSGVVSYLLRQPHFVSAFSIVVEPRSCCLVVQETHEQLPKFWTE